MSNFIFLLGIVALAETLGYPIKDVGVMFLLTAGVVADIWSEYWRNNK